ncbi:hypothetical protein [Bacillus altitudinis]|uniref:hypothetical protein n=1 Tax=Bacillus altitudinis TaxID=293387 RepID=UPI002281526E|nr:hypothetical protein [Bacillus altitudinis]MCY7449238.1 hypothetical protein [Bacillus altitudinis]MCY7453754.1 hypothetical protein [Bacillus altitudinis]MCY7530697.1 hypothetical protein [Bacillus altitudinis]
MEIIKKKISELLEEKNSLLNNEYVQLIGDTSKLINLVRGASELMLQKKFKSFLKGFSIDEKPTEIQLRKLKEYIDNETKAEFVADTFSKILLSNSSKACLIMGTILKDIVEMRNDLKHEELIAINALKEFYDVDIVNFNIIQSVFVEKSEEKIGSTDILSKIKHNNLDDISVLMTLDKAAATQLLFVTTSVDMSTEVNKFENRRKEADNFYVMTSGGKLLTKYIKRI